MKKRKKQPRAFRSVLLAVSAILSMALAGIYTSWRSQATAVSYELSDEKTVRSWTISEKTPRYITPDGLKIAAQEKTFLISPEVRGTKGAALYWGNFPYVKLHLTPQAEEYLMYLVWILDKNRNKQYVRSFTVPAMAAEVLIDVRQHEPTKGQFGYPWDFPPLEKIPIGRVGLVFGNTIEIRRIELLSSLGLFQFAKLLGIQYWQPEPIGAYSINNYYGNEIFGTPLVAASGIVFFIFLMLFIWLQRKPKSKFRLPLLWAMFACFAICNLPFVHTLWEEAKAGTEVSAWHADRYDEYRSRFNSEFADLDRAFRTHVPAGSRVAFPLSEKKLVNGEINWIWFLYFGPYVNYTNRDYYSSTGKQRSGITKKTEYVFYYYPRKLIYNEQNNTLREADYPQAPPYRTRTVADISEHAKILKIIRD